MIRVRFTLHDSNVHIPPGTFFAGEFETLIELLNGLAAHNSGDWAGLHVKLPAARDINLRWSGELGSQAWYEWLGSIERLNQ